MAITRAINQRVLVAVSILLLIIAGSVYLHLQQKHHLGRMNTQDRRVKPAAGGSENLYKNETIYISLLPTIPSNTISSTTKSNNLNSKSHNDNEDTIHNEEDYNLQGDDYPNDATSTTSSHGAESREPKATHKSSTVSYLIDNDYRSNIDIKYLNSTDKLGLTSHCFHCLCITLNRCMPYKWAHMDRCGIYGISKYYWLDGGSPTTNVENNIDNDYGEENQAHIDYLRCVNNDNCAKNTVRNYIKRYQRDCNNDGIIDCYDHITLHILGPSGCVHEKLSPIHRMRMKACLK